MTGESPRDASLLLRLEFVFMWMPLKLNQLLSRKSGHTRQAQAKPCTSSSPPGVFQETGSPEKTPTPILYLAQRRLK